MKTILSINKTTWDYNVNNKIKFNKSVSLYATMETIISISEIISLNVNSKIKFNNNNN